MLCIMRLDEQYDFLSSDSILILILFLVRVNELLVITNNGRDVKKMNRCIQGY